MVGKLNMDEFAWPPTENSASRSRASLGLTASRRSSGGSAAPCRRYVSGALGSDTGGSIRQPLALRRGRAQADLRPRIALRPCGLCSSSINRTAHRQRADAALLLNGIAATMRGFHIGAAGGAGLHGCAGMSIKGIG